MDDLTLLREYRADEAGPSAAETASARTALLAAIEAEPAKSRPRPRRVWIPVIAAAAVGLTAVGLIVTSGPTTPTARPATALDAAYVLHQAARSAARQGPADGRYFFTESEYVDDVVIVRPHQRTLRWASPTIRRYWLGHHVRGVLKDPAAGPGPASLPPGVATEGGSSLSWDQVRHLPTAPQRLRRVIAGLAGNQQPRPVSEFRVITELLYESPAPPALRAALYNLAATLPGVRLVRGAQDLIGRAATEVYLAGGWELPGGGGQALFFSPHTSAVLGWAELSGASPRCPPVSEYAVLATGYLDTTHQVPPGTPGHLLPANYRRHVPGCAAP